MRALSRLMMPKVTATVGDSHLGSARDGNQAIASRIAAVQSKTAIAHVNGL
jgi:hypothetical protein